MILVQFLVSEEEAALLRKEAERREMLEEWMDAHDRARTRPRSGLWSRRHWRRWSQGNATAAIACLTAEDSKS